MKLINLYPFLLFFSFVNMPLNAQCPCQPTAYLTVDPTSSCCYLLNLDFTNSPDCGPISNFNQITINTNVFGGTGNITTATGLATGFTATLNSATQLTLSTAPGFISATPSTYVVGQVCFANSSAAFFPALINISNSNLTPDPCAVNSFHDDLNTSCGPCICDQDLSLTQSGIAYNIFCDPHVGSIPILPCSDDDVIVSGFFGCINSTTGELCPETPVNWTLLWNNNLLDSGTTTNYPDWILPESLVDDAGLYCLTVSTICPGAVDSCVCKVQWIKEECDTCFCPTDSIPRPNLVANGDFESGNVGFSSDLAYNQACGASTYWVGNNFTDKCGSWPSICDNTAPPCNGNFLIVDGNPNGPATIWEQQVNIVPDSTYCFSFWTANVYGPTQQNFNLDIVIYDNANNACTPNIGTANIFQVQNQPWVNHTFIWTCPSTCVGQHTIAIEQNSGGAFRDFGIDDICFTNIPKPPDTCCTDLAAFCEVLDRTISITVDNDSCKAIVNISHPDLCNFYIEYIDWGVNPPQQTPGPLTGDTMVMFDYPGSGSYEICYLAIELDDDGFICNEKFVCDTIDLACIECACPDLDNLVSNSGFENGSVGFPDALDQINQCANWNQSVNGNGVASIGDWYSYSNPFFPGSFNDQAAYINLPAHCGEKYGGFDLSTCEGISSTISPSIVAGDAYTVGFWWSLKEPVTSNFNFHAIVSQANCVVSLNNGTCNHMCNGDFHIVVPVLANFHVPGVWYFHSKAGTSGWGTMNNITFAGLKSATPVNNYVYIDDVCVEKTPAPCSVTAGILYYPGQPSSFTAQATLGLGSTITQVDWDFGDNSTLTSCCLNSTIHTFLPGSYSVCLVVTAVNSVGEICKDTACVDIAVIDLPDKCDSISVFLQQLHTYSTTCCYSLETNNLVPNCFSQIELTLSSGIFTNPSISPGWTATGFGNQLILTPTAGGYIPVGTDNPITYCNPGGSNPYTLDVNFGYTSSLGTPDNCHQSIDFDCFITPTDSCCTDYNLFCQTVEDAVSITADNDSCKAKIILGNLPDCDYLEYLDWGDGQIDYGQFTSGNMLMHMFPGSGSYEICYLAVELDDDGFICFEKLICDTIDIDCSCVCGTYSDLSYRPFQGAPNIPAACGDTLLAQCNGPIPWTFGGNFLCVGNSCPDSTEMSWSLIKPTSTSSGTMSADPGFNISIPATEFDESGIYQLILKSICGQDTCYCEFFIEVDCGHCCADFDAFCQNAENSITISQDTITCKAKVNIDNLPDCDYFEYINWGDGHQDNGPYSSGDMMMHVYQGPGTYVISLLAIELDNAGFICFEKFVTDTIDIDCDPCCRDSIAFINAASMVQTNGTLGDCMIHFNAIGLDSCMQISYLWGDNTASEGPYGNNTAVWHTYPAEGTYNVCYYIDEIDENGVVCWTYEHCEDVLVLSPDTCVVAPTGMVGWWPMDEQIGDALIKDIIGSNNALPMPLSSVGSPNGPNPVPGKVAGALQYVGAPGSSSTWAKVPNTAALNFGSGSFSIDAWINTNMGTQTEPIVDKLGNLNTGYALSIQGTFPNYNLTLVIGSTSTSGPVQYLQGPSITAGIWNFVAVSVNTQVPTGPIVDFYVGNANTSNLLLHSNNSISPTNASNSEPLLIGNNPINPHWDISIDELEIFNRYVDSTELYSIFKADSLGKCRDSMSAVINLIPGRDIRIYPNPTRGELRLEINERLDRSIKLEIIDLRGRIVESMMLEPDQKEHTLSIEALSSGIYFIRVVENGSPVWIDKIIKN